MSRTGAVVGFVIALALLAAALAIALHNADVLARARDAAANASAWLVAAALVLPLMNWTLVACSFWGLSRMFGRVGLGEMHALVGASWLVNLLPFRAGMVGRIAYHRVINGIPVRASVAVTLIALACTGVWLVSLAGLAAWMGPRAGPRAWMPALATPLPIVTLAAIFAPARARPFTLCLLIRYADALVWVARYAVLFAIVGTPLNLGGAVAVSVVSQLASLVPLSGNGLGLREWAVGLTARLLPAGAIAAHDAMASGVLADLVNRAAELLVGVPLGLIALHRLRPKLSAVRLSAQTPAPPPRA